MKKEDNLKRDVICSKLFKGEKELDYKEATSEDVLLFAIYLENNYSARGFFKKALKCCKKAKLPPTFNLKPIQELESKLNSEPEYEFEELKPQFP